MMLSALKDFMEFTFVVAGGVFLVLVLAIVLFMLIAIPVEHITFEGRVEQVEIMRQAAREVDCAINDDIAGMVVKTNKDIAWRKYQNTIPIWGIIMPNDWEFVAPIKMPKCGE